MMQGSVTFPPSAPPDSISVARNVTIKAEYLYVDLGNVNCGLSCGPVAPNNVSFRSNIVRAGLNYRF